MTGGPLPGGPVIENVSVRHSVAVLIATPGAAVATLPPTSKPLDKVIVDGPLITNEVKSSLNWINENNTGLPCYMVKIR